MVGKLIGRIIFLLWVVLLCPKAFALEIMLPQVYDESVDVSGWLVSEKLDGVRGYWDGNRLLSKNGIPLNLPPEFLANFPKFVLEGEIWGGRGTFAKTAGVVRRKEPAGEWLDLKFAVFDAPDGDTPFIKRLERARVWFAEHPSPYAFVIPQKTVADKKELRDELGRVEKLGGEGLIVRRADTLYSTGRSSDILKVKSYLDMEGVVVAHLPGTGRNENRMGSLLVELPNGIRCRIGSGFTDREREDPPPVGTTITFKYYGFYQSGIPKFPSFLRIRSDNGL